MGYNKVTFDIDLKDFSHVLFEVLNVENLFGYDEYKHLDRSCVEEALMKANNLAKDKLFPLISVADREPPFYEDGKVIMPEPLHRGYNELCRGGWIAISRKKGTSRRNLGFPQSIAMAIREMHYGACGGLNVFPTLTNSALNLIDTFGVDSLRKQFCDKMARGEFTGTMCITENNSGSFLGDISTKAERKGDIFFINGKKVLIGAGDHNLTENIVHCVLAHIEGAPKGYKGLSLFVVPKFRANEEGRVGDFNDVYCSGIENKMGWDAAPTARLQFGEKHQCHGWLLGKEGEGLSQMFQMMNEMRLVTAVQAVGQAAAVYQIALHYAKNRKQGLSYKRKKGDPVFQVPIIDHPDIRRNLLFMKSLVEGCRRIVIKTAYYIDLVEVITEEKEKQYYQNLVDILTLVGKAYPTDMAFQVAERAVQTLGGYGYIKDYLVEQYLRDIKPASIYEGTNGVLAINLQKKQLVAKEGRVFLDLVNEIDKFIVQHIKHPRLGRLVAELNKSKETMIELAKSFTIKGQEDAGLALSVAKPFMDLTGHIICTWLLLESATTADSMLYTVQAPDQNKDFYQGKITTANFAVTNLLAEAEGIAAMISSWDRSVSEIKEEEF